MRKSNRDYRLIAQRLTRSRPELAHIRDYGIKIAYLESDEEKKKNYKKVHADCTKVDEKYKWTCPYDFFITVYQPNIEGFSEKQLEVLLLHELMHVGVDDEGQEPSFYIVPHDIEDFRAIIDEYGLDWSVV